MTRLSVSGVLLPRSSTGRPASWLRARGVSLSLECCRGLAQAASCSCFVLLVQTYLGCAQGRLGVRACFFHLIRVLLVSFSAWIRRFVIYSFSSPARFVGSSHPLSVLQFCSGTVHSRQTRSTDHPGEAGTISCRNWKRTIGLIFVVGTDREVIHTVAVCREQQQMDR